MMRRTEQSEGPIKVLLHSHNKRRGPGQYERLDVRRKLGVDGIAVHGGYMSETEFTWNHQVEIYRMMKDAAPERVRAIELMGFDYSQKRGCLEQSTLIGVVPAMTFGTAVLLAIRSIS